MSQNACLVQDWHMEGVVAGLHGISESDIQKHLQNCSKTGTLIDPCAYERGYYEGIEQLCTKPGGFEAGKLGSPYGGGCPAELEEAFLIGYETGRSLFVADLDLRIVKTGFAAGAASSEFIGTPPSQEGILHRLETFPQTKETRRALVSQYNRSRFNARSNLNNEVIGNPAWRLSHVIRKCELVKEKAKELGFEVDDFC